MDRVVILHNSGQVAEAIERRGKAAVTGIDRAMGRGARELTNDIKNTAPEHESTMRNSANAVHIAPLWHEVQFGTGYASYVNRGTGPGGRPSLAEMLVWVRRKGIQPRTPGMSQRSLAALIRKSIAQRGIQKQPFAEESLDRMRPKLSQLMRGALREAMAGDRA